MGKYMHGERQKAAIIQAGIDLWHEGGEASVTARGIGKRVKLSHAGVLFHFDAIADLKQQVKRAGVERGDKQIIQALLVTRDPVVAHFTDDQRRAWMAA